MKKITTLLLLVVCACGAKAQIITTVTGTGHAGYNGDNIAASGAEIYGPYGVAIDKSGNLYIADYGNFRIRKVSSGGTITTIAGTGVDGFSGEKVPATNAKISLVRYIIVDDTGNVYFSDEGNNRVRKITTNDTIITIAGNSDYGYNGDNMPATAATLWGPLGLAIDKTGNIYIADNANDRVRMVNSSGIITTIAGNGITGYSGDGDAATNTQIGRPTGLAIDNTGNIFIGGNQRIVKIENGTTLVSTYAGTGISGYSGDGSAATSAEIMEPGCIVSDDFGNIFFADGLSQVVRKINTTTNIITTIAGTGTYGYNGDNMPATSALLDGPVGVSIDAAGGIYIADFQNNRVRYIRNTVGVSTVAEVNDYVKIYPNPSNGTFNILVSSKTNAQVAVSITDQLGRVMVKQHTVQTNVVMQMSENMPPGMYLLMVQDGAQLVETTKLLIE